MKLVLYKIRSSILILVLMVIFILACINFAFAVSEPEGPSSLTIAWSNRRSAASAPIHRAVAGNVTALTVEGTTVTQGWAGYMGNISGTITLDDSSNKTLYSWSLANPEGEIYAANGTINWTTGNVLCYNITKNDTSDAAYVMISELNSNYGFAHDDVDSVNRTFTDGTDHPGFYVGGQEIPTTLVCPETNLYNSSEVASTSYFHEVLLYDYGYERIIYASIIEENSVLGFDGRDWDFEMIVAENGHSGDTATTVYYFYAELE